MDRYDEVNPYETTRQQNDFDIPNDPAEAGFAQQQGFVNQTPQQNYQPQQYAQPYQQNFQAQQYAQPNAQPYQQNYQSQQFAQPRPQPYQQNFQAQQYAQPNAQPYNTNVQGVNYEYQQYFNQNPQVKEPQGSAKGLGIAGLVCGIASMPLAFNLWGGLIAGILGLIFSSISKKRSAQQGVENKKANTGFVLSIIGLSLSALLIFFVIVYAVNNPGEFLEILESVD